MSKTNDLSFVAINYIDCQEDYKVRFEELFASRAHFIDKMPGFKNMEVLKPSDKNGSYLIVSHWESESHFKAWTSSSEFLEGHKRGFEDIAAARKEGKTPPMTSSFKTYNIISK
jgi:heme oxygenase (mycobilin-producing)